MRAAIFDMDGVLIDSEPLWRRAEKEVFGRVGIALTKDMCLKTMGLRLDEVVAYWHQQFPWTEKSLQQVEEEVLSAMHKQISEEGKALRGVHETLELLQGAGLMLAIASSSPLSLIKTVVNKLEIHAFFQSLCSAEEDEFGKPDPAVYLRTADRLAVDPRECFVFEDSLLGVRSAKSAGMTVFAVPAADQYDDPRFNEADFKVRSLQEFSFDMIKKEKETAYEDQCT
ncbi:MAG: hexitol phosphatase HxpB [Syntrophales bacterium]|jgi:sugar-phosphatase|nr:hexitol phosphatase HxpB [Syntrophales bacterium]